VGGLVGLGFFELGRYAGVCSVGRFVVGLGAGGLVFGLVGLRL